MWGMYVYVCVCMCVCVQCMCVWVCMHVYVCGRYVCCMLGGGGDAYIYEFFVCAYMCVFVSLSLLFLC